MPLPRLDWSDLELLRLVATGGTIASAANQLGIDQTTASRRLARVEKSIGASLFDRIDRRLVPTSILREILPALQSMADTVSQAESVLGTAKRRLEGEIIVTAVEMLITEVLGPAFGALHRRHPGLSLLLSAGDRNLSLARREADVAVRLNRPKDDVAQTRRIGAIPMSLYGPADAQNPASLPFACYEQFLADLPEMRWLHEQYPEADIRFRANRALALAEAAACGFRTILPWFIGNRNPRLRIISGAKPVLTREVWMLIHPERRSNPGVRATINWIEEAMAPVML